MNDESHQMATSLSEFNRFSMLMQKSFEVMNLGVEDGNTMRIVMKNLVNNTKTEISLDKSSVVVTDDVDDDNDNEASLWEMSILDFLRRKGKERSYGMLKSSRERKKEKEKI